MIKTATYALALVAVVAATIGASALIASYVDLPDWLRIGSWHWPMLAGAVLLLSRWRFGTIMPGVLGGVAGTVFLAVLGCMISDIWVRGLIAPLLAAYPAMLMLQACEQAVALRCGQQVTPGWLNPLITASVLIFLFICLGLSATGDNREMSVWHEVVASSGAAAVLTVLFMLPGHSALRSTVWLARLLFPAPGRWPADGATVLNSLCGYGTFALSCLTLPLFMPLAWILPGGRQRWVATAMRRAMR